MVLPDTEPTGVADIRITDPYVKRLIAAQQRQRGDRTPTKTAGSLIIERCSQLELLEVDATPPARRRRR